MQAEKAVETQPGTEKQDKFLTSLADRLGVAARSSTIFGEPVERPGVTVIPVAKARWGFGGGAGRSGEERGVGGGGGVQVSPVGYIEVRDGQTQFRRIHAVSSPGITLLGLAGLLLLRSFIRRAR